MFLRANRCYRASGILSLTFWGLNRFLSLCRFLIQQGSQLMIAGVIGLIKGYQYLLSPLHRPCCRFIPSCSSYAIVSFKKYGLIKGLLKTMWRLARCHPLGKGGYEPP